MKSLFQQKALKEVRSGLERQLQQAKKASAFIKQIENGNLSIDVPEDLLESELGESLYSINNHLTKL